MKYQAGDSVALTRMRVWVTDGVQEPVERIMSGLFTLDEQVLYEPAAYHWQSGWYVFPAGEVRLEGDAIIVSDSEGLSMFIADDDMLPQILPQNFARYYDHERKQWIETERWEYETQIDWEIHCLRNKEE